MPKILLPSDNCRGLGSRQIRHLRCSLTRSFKNRIWSFRKGNKRKKSKQPVKKSGQNGDTLKKLENVQP